VKHDDRHKAHIVANGNLTDMPLESVYSGVVSLRRLRTARFEWIRALYSPYITGTDRRSTVLTLDADFLRDKTSLSSEVPSFCSIFNSNRSSKSTNLLIHRPSLHSIADLCSFV
jgi:hypothetical protein